MLILDAKTGEEVPKPRWIQYIITLDDGSVVASKYEIQERETHPNIGITQLKPIRQQAKQKCKQFGREGFFVESIYIPPHRIRNIRIYFLKNKGKEQLKHL